MLDRVWGRFRFVSGGAILRVLGADRGLPGLRTLKLDVEYLEKEDDDALAALAQAFTSGLFPSLLELSVLQGKEICAGLAAFVRALEAAPCARTLRFLSLCFGIVDNLNGTGFQALGDAIAAGRFPSLAALNLHKIYLPPEWARHLVSSLRARGAPPLEALALCSTTPGAIASVAAALRAGCLGKRLQWLSLVDGDGSASSAEASAGVDALSKALAQQGRTHLRDLQVLKVKASGMAIEAMKGLVKAAVVNCPGLKWVAVCDGSGAWDGRLKVLKRVA